MKRTKKMLAFLLTLVLCVGMLPMSAFAAGNRGYTASDQSTKGQSVQKTITDENVTDEDEVVPDEQQTVIDQSTAETSDVEESTPMENEVSGEETISTQNSFDEETPVVDESDTNTVNTTDDSTEEESDAEAQQIEEPIMVSRDSVTLLDASDSEEVTVSVSGAGNTSTLAISLGELNENNESLSIEGYDFIRAQVGDENNFTTITGLYEIANSDDYYATIEGNTTTGIRISDPLQVVLVYEAHRDTYAVTYEVWVDGQQLSENINSVLTLTGASTVKSGNNLEFAAVVQDGYVLNSGSPSASSGIVTRGDNNTYTVTGITKNVTIKFELTESTSYKMSFNGSNTTLTYKGKSYDSRSNGSAYSWSYTADEKITFTLKGWNEYTTTAKILNQLSISIDDVSVAAEIPDTTGDSATTIIAKGYEVTVTKDTAGQYPQYTVAVTNPDGGKVRGTIHIQTNFKDYNSSEVWAKQLDGVEPLAYSYGSNYNKTYVTSDGNGDQKSRLQPNVYTYFSRNNYKNQDSTYYIKLTGDYSPDDLYLTVMNYSAERYKDASFQGNIINNVRLSDLSSVKDKNNALRDYDYQFDIPADDSGTSGTYTDEYVDIRIYIQYKPNADATYSFEYDLNGGKGDFSGESDLKVSDSFVISEELPTQGGYVFDGWYLEDEPDTLYQPGDLFTITNDNISLAGSDHNFVFKAKWTSESQAKYARFQVQIFFQNEDGTYNATPDLTTTESGRIGLQAYIIPEALNNFLNTGKPGWDEEYMYDYQETDDPIASDGSTVLKIFYKQSVFYVYHTGITDGKVETIKMSSLTNGTYDLTQNLTANTLYGGYYLNYDNAETGEVYDGTNATWTDPQTENGKAMHPEAGKTYYVKEVPISYLQATQVSTYHKYTLQLRTMILTTVVDDSNYKSVGFRFNDNDYNKVVNVDFNVDKLSDSLTFEMPERDGTITTNTVGVGDLSNDKIKSGKIAAYDYFNYVNDSGEVDYSGIIGTNRIKAFWVTPDGITVTGGYQRTLIVRDADNDSIIEVDGIVDGTNIINKEIMYLDAKSAVQILNR